MILTGARLRALERRKPDDEACGEVETAHPGHPDSRDTFHAGTLRGVGRVHRRTCVDAYRRVAHARLYTSVRQKTPCFFGDRAESGGFRLHGAVAGPVGAPPLCPVAFPCARLRLYPRPPPLRRSPRPGHRAMAPFESPPFPRAKIRHLPSKAG